jgi:branched-chain amino acid transport system ATP-binding protein
VNALAVEDLCKSFGSLEVLRSVTLAVAQGERRAVLGLNGAGKTTLFHIISGLIAPSAGRVHLFARDVTTLPPDRRAAMGLSRTFQVTSLFPNLTVRENLLLAVQSWQGRPWGMFRPAFSYPPVARRVEELLEQWGFRDQADARVSRLSHGEQRHLEIVLAVGGKPRVLLLDEPTAGLSPAETAAVTAMIDAFARDLTLLLIEHDLDVVFRLATRITVLHLGQVVAEGTPEEIQGNARVRDIYFRKDR